MDHTSFVSFVIDAYIKRTVKVFKFKKYDNALLPPSYIKSHNNKKYICITCDKHLKKGSLPCQSISNKLQLMPIATPTVVNT